MSLDVSDEAREFMMTLLNPKPEERGTALTAIQLEWFKKHQEAIRNEIID